MTSIPKFTPPRIEYFTPPSSQNKKPRFHEFLLSKAKYMVVTTTAASQPFPFLFQWTAGPLLAKFLALAGPACFFVLQLSPFQTCQEIWKNKTTGQLSPIPFLALLTNCVVWGLYGAFKGDLSILVPNTCGLFFGTYYNYTFYKNAANRSFYLKGVVVCSIIVAAVIGMALFLPEEVATQSIGITGDILAVCMMFAPLAVLKTVIREKNTSSMPFATSLAILLNILAWSGYSMLVVHDFTMLVPNLVGFPAAVAQMALFIIYPRRAKIGGPTKRGSGGSNCSSMGKNQPQSKSSSNPKPHAA